MLPAACLSLRIHAVTVSDVRGLANSNAGPVRSGRRTDDIPEPAESSSGLVAKVPVLPGDKLPDNPGRQLLREL